MAKRIVTRVGNVFCVEFDDRYKCFFQFIAIDCESLGGSTIRVFKRRYPIDYKPNLEEIVHDEILFYANTILRVGIDMGTWYKVGSYSKDLGLDELEKIWFTTTGSPNKEGICVANDRWHIWHPAKLNSGTYVNTEYVRELLARNEKIFTGGVAPYVNIAPRIKCGYSTWTAVEYSVLHRVPREDVDSYTKREDGGVVRYTHFYGADAVQEVIVDGRGGIIRLDRDHSEDDGYELRRAKFWETNWTVQEFITVEEFEDAWHQN